MYDDSNLGVSEFYFFISQLLRFASDWIRETTDDLHVLVQELERAHFSPEAKKDACWALLSFLPDSPEARDTTIEIFKQNWAIVLSHQQNLADEILNRIARKQEEVNSLRDGVGHRVFRTEHTEVLTQIPTALHSDRRQRSYQVETTQPLHHRLYRRHHFLPSPEFCCREFRPPTRFVPDS
jgi:hypothetical protein